ncbi:MAG: ATP-binding cassette domain-containing protein, partial [Trichodesmium sp. St11_bin5]|nr:ATP-binding cassette domain-containing protein [Trichodesmium sp. St11_bin5]
LSGGEKARLALAKMLLKPGNFMLLDEPTNHLDIPAKEMLESALKNYDGTVIIVSHDRYFISQVANKIVEIRDGEFYTYLGDYHYYIDKLESEKELERLAKIAAEKAAKKAQKAAKKKQKKKKVKNQTPPEKS